MFRMAKALVFGLVLALTSSASLAQLVETPRVCNRNPCAVEPIVSDEDSFTLSCGVNGETIVSVALLSVGEPEGVCPDEGPPAPALYDINVTDGCNATAIPDDILDACLGEESCLVNITEIIQSIGTDLSGLESCAGTINDARIAVVVNCQDPFNTLGILTVGVTALIGFALGATITKEKFFHTIKFHKRAVIIGFCCQFGFMPLIAYIYCAAFQIQPLVALGVILTGSVPGGTTSNLLTYYAKGNVALSIIMSVASTFCALFMVPFSIFLYFNVALNNGDSVEPPFLDIILALFIVIIPVSFGIFVREKSEKWAKRCEIAGSILGALFLLAAVVSGILDSPDLFNPSLFQVTWIGAAFFQPVASVLGFLASKLARLPGPELRAVVLETGVQNYTIAISAAAFSFQGCDRTAVLTFILAAAFWYVVNSVWITALLRFVQARGDEEEIKEMDAEDKELDAVIGA